MGCHRLVEVFNNSSLDITKGSSNYGYVAYYALNVKKGRGSEVVNQNGYLFYTYDETNYLLGYAGAETELTLRKNYNGKSYLIYEYAFYDCADLTSIEIPNSVTAIGDYAFYWCTELKSVTIDSSVTSIDTGAFDLCTGLQDIYYNGTISQWNAISKDSNWVQPRKIHNPLHRRRYRKIKKTYRLFPRAENRHWKTVLR